jgi:hypothetical protein
MLFYSTSHLASLVLTTTILAASNYHLIQGHSFGDRLRSMGRRLLAQPPDPEEPPATRHPPLLFHKPLPLCTLQSSIISTMSDETTRSSAHSPTAQLRWTMAGRPSHGSVPTPVASARRRKPLIFTSRARGGYTCLLVTSLSKIEYLGIDD